MPSFAVRHGGVIDSQEELTGRHNLREQIVWCLEGMLGSPRRIDQQVKLVQLLPHLERDGLSHRSRVLARSAQARNDRVWIGHIKREEINRVFARCLAVAFKKDLIVTSGGNQWRPLFGASACIGGRR